MKAPVYDPTGKHSLVYTWGITGIVYNKNFIKENSHLMGRPVEPGL